MDGRSHRTVRLVAVAATVAVVIGGLVGLARLVADGSRPAPAAGSSAASTAPTSTAVPVVEPLDVSGGGVGSSGFGTDEDEVVAAVTARLGAPDVVTGPQRYFRISASEGWYEVADDPISPSWRYPVASRTCWGALCLVFGGDEADALRLRGWVLAQADPSAREPLPDVRLADSGIRLGDSWEQLHAAYPDTVVRGGEGASLAIADTPWAGVSDGVAAWRVSGVWDFEYPDRVPDGSTVTRLSGGEGPEPGCC